MKNLNENGIIIVETEKNEILKEKYNGVWLFKDYVYGKKKLTVFKTDI